MAKNAISGSLLGEIFPTYGTFGNVWRYLGLLQLGGATWQGQVGKAKILLKMLDAEDSLHNKELFCPKCQQCQG